MHQRFNNNSSSNNNNSWTYNQLTPAHLLYLQSQMQQQHQNIELFSNQTNGLQENYHSTIKQIRNQPGASAVVHSNLPFKSSFSVNSLLNTTDLTLPSHQSFAAALTQHLTVAMARLNHQQQQQQQAMLQQQQQTIIRENELSAFQVPKKMKLSPPNDNNNDQLNSSSCSISSPSSSSSSVFSTSSSFDYSSHQTHQDQNNNLVDKLKFNDSDYFNGDNSNNNNKSSSDSSIEMRKIGLKRLNRKRVSIDLQNLSCPICRCTLQFHELQSHLDSELADLDKLNGSIESSTYFSPPISRKRSLSGSEKITSNDSIILENGTNSAVLLLNKIKENRQLRLKNKLCLRMNKRNNFSNNKTLSSCPLCNKSITDLRDHIHSENCSAMLKEKNLDFSSTTTSEINDDSEEKTSNKDDFNTDLDESNETADDESEENSNDLLKKEFDTCQTNNNNNSNDSLSIQIKNESI